MTAWRMFLAIDIVSTPEIEAVRQRLRAFGPPVRIVQPDSGRLHVTVKFLGDVDPVCVDEIERRLLEERCCTRLEDGSDRGEPLRLELCGLGAFPNPRRPAVVWCGFRDAWELHELHHAVERSLAGMFPTEARAYRPHVTLAYVKGRLDRRGAPRAGSAGCDLRSFLEERVEVPLGTREASRLILYRSELTSEGARHTPIRQWAFPAFRANRGSER